MKKISFGVVPQRIKMQGMYCIDVFWGNLEDSLRRYKKAYNLQLNPDFQRGHIWKEGQQIRYIEFIMSGGITGKNVYFNCPNWSIGCGPLDVMVCVDGLQRLTAARKFINNGFKVFNKYYAEDFTRLDYRCGFKFNINDLVDKKNVLQWYLEMNTGGTPHNKEELQKVRNLLKEDLKK